jgi:hypothetical protein
MNDSNANCKNLAHLSQNGTEMQLESGGISVEASAFLVAN